MTPRTAADNRRYNLAARQKRQRLGLCTLACGAKLPPGYEWRTCSACRAKNRALNKARGATKTCVRRSVAERLDIYRRYLACPGKRYELAAQIGISYKALGFIVHKVRAAVKDLDAKPLGYRIGPRMVKKEFPRCKCGLLLPCWNCVTATEAGSRRVA